MKTIKKLAMTSAFMLVSFSGLAQSITASGERVLFCGRD